MFNFLKLLILSKKISQKVSKKISQNCDEHCNISQKYRKITYGSKNLTSYYERQRLLYGCNPLARRAGLFRQLKQFSTEINILSQN